jgi:anti-anti-sigma regulatory factor
VVEPFKIESAHAGPFVTVLTIVGAVEDGAHESLRAELENPDLSSRSVIVDLTEAVLYDSSPFPLLADRTERLGENGGRLVVVSGDNPTVKPFVGDQSLPGLRWFESLDDAMVELLGDLATLGEWPPPEAPDDEQRGAAPRD